jgi:hypothetical protein
MEIMKDGLNKMMCDVCKREGGIYKVTDIRNGNILIICAFCDDGNYRLVQEETEEEKQENEIKEEHKNMGRLHLITKCKKEYLCRECGETILVGSLCYRQNFYGNSPYPSQSHVCESCGDKLNKEGIEIVK